MREQARRRPVSLAAGLLVCAGLGPTSFSAQAAPPIIPATAPIVVGATLTLPPVVVVVSGRDGRGTPWATSGRADVDVDIERSTHHGRVLLR
jgi:hypothetical protein